MERNYLNLGIVLLLLDANYNDVLKVISNWCFYEIGASIYFMDDNTNYCALLSKQSNCHRVGKRILQMFWIETQV